MSKKIDIDYISELSKISLTEDEKKVFAVQLSKILEYFDQLSELETDRIEQVSKENILTCPLRDDEVEPFDCKDQALANAPMLYQDQYLVPSTITINKE